jgi:hypothetical protein
LSGGDKAGALLYIGQVEAGLVFSQVVDDICWYLKWWEFGEVDAELVVVQVALVSFELGWDFCAEQLIQLVAFLGGVEDGESFVGGQFDGFFGAMPPGL